MSLLAGRERERSLLRQAVASPEAELIAVYGRRRVGKTFLVREHFAAELCFELVGAYEVPLDQQLGNFAAALATARRKHPLPQPRDWADAFRQLAEHLARLPKSRQKRVIFFDELPWLASRRSGFMPAFEHFWNGWAVKQRGLVVVVSGSAASWMLEHLVTSRGGLHNRVTRRIRLEPFTLAETESYLAQRRITLTRYQLLELYIAFGGVPHYLKQLERGESAAQAIDRLCFSPDGLLRDEFGRLYASLFEHPERHEHVVRTLAKKRYGMTRNELIAAAGLTSGGRTTTLLDELDESGFVTRLPQFGFDTKDVVVRLTDEYSLFYLSFIEPGRGRGGWLTRRGSPAWRAWSGYAFEGVCVKHAQRLKRALGIEAVETHESAWKSRDAQVDLLVDRRDLTVNLCELKFSEGEFVIDKRYAAELRNKRDSFRRATGTKKAVLLTLVTTHGVRDNAWRRELVDKELTMDALF
ncbi:MAG: ATP-binding protein [Myxococcaceae bacterium]|nr:ATP-binding protein [Myxococcaceae bacterium]